MAQLICYDYLASKFNVAAKIKAVTELLKNVVLTAQERQCASEYKACAINNVKR